SMSSNQSGEGEIRRSLIEADLVDCMVALPGQLFYSTQIPACLWFLARDRKNGKFRDRRGQVLFIDARKMGRMVDRTHRELTDEDIARIANTYHAWRNVGADLRVCPDVGADLRVCPDTRANTKVRPYKDIPGFCKSATIEEIRKHGYVLTPGRYVGAEVVEDDGEPFEEKMKRLVAQLREQQAEAAKLDAAIAANLKELGYGG
ncbi:MAG: SAM-dependent methyltransferase, partial [Bryobacteraceae bacterium]|nr:SAM-dependent methyltransferase [Bryobacteraceae bacterium]